MWALGGYSSVHNSNPKSQYTFRGRGFHGLQTSVVEPHIHLLSKPLPKIPNLLSLPEEVYISRNLTSGVKSARNTRRAG